MARKWTAEQKEAARQRQRERMAKKSDLPEKVVAVAVSSVNGTSSADVAKLMQEVADLKVKLGIAEKARGEAENEALRLSESQGSYLSPIPVEEVPTGRFTEIKVQDPETPWRHVGFKEDGRDIVRPNFIKQKVPTFFYKIWMPPVGGTDLKINGSSFYHGTVYEFDIHTLRSVKDTVYKVWRHDKDIHNQEENAYRKPLNINAAIPGALSAAIAQTSQRLRG